jgi:hypothetical protein
MWNRSYQWQRRARLAAGAAVLVLLAASVVVLQGTSPARRARAGAHDLAREMWAGEQQFVTVAVPASLDAREGTLVYLEREDGIAQVIGRVVAVAADDREHVRLSIRMMTPAAGLASAGGVLKGAPASLNLRDAVRLLISPNTPNEEAALARDTIWPSIRTYVLPGLIDRLVQQVSKEPAALDERDQALLAESIEQVGDELKPLEEKLLNRLALRSWEIVGVKGLAAGIWRTTTSKVQDKGKDVADRWKEALGKESTTTPVKRPFLSDETNVALQKALGQEAAVFWKEHRNEVIDAVGRVAAQRRPQFEAAFRERWAGVLFERAVEPAWLAGQDKVLEAVQEYANDFAARRLLTKDGGPRLLFAYTLRSSLKVSDAPLLVFAPGTKGETDRIVFEPYLR